ncbi:hypothetical protein EV424DRAFT_1419126 [Suillus variegatus]|nr:hypothetical protein EV424DRAFT_1419126 [Suillus variegatus]
MASGGRWRRQAKNSLLETETLVIVSYIWWMIGDGSICRSVCSFTMYFYIFFVYLCMLSQAGGKLLQPPQISDSLLGWLPPLIRMKEPELVDKLGLDECA